MSFVLPKLPFETNALEPHMSQQTIDYHYGKHTLKYYQTANELTKGTIFEDATSLEQLLTLQIYPKLEGTLRNNVAQAWNHTFFWEGITPDKTNPSKILTARLVQDFGSVEKFKEEFTTKAVKLFGSGWVWLILKEGRLEIRTTHNAGTHLPTKQILPLLVCDLWEHSYYLDYPADKQGYIKAWWNLVNWEKVSDRFKKD